MSNEIIKSNNQIAISTNKDALAVIDPKHQEIIKMALAPKISNIPALDCMDALIDIFRDASTNSGEVYDDDAGLYAANETYDWLIRLYPEVTIDEIRAAIRAGVYGEYGKYFGLNPKSYVFFVRSYLDSEKRRVAKNAFESAKSKVKEISPRLTKGQWKELILSDYRLFKNGESNMIVFMPKKYALLEQEGMITIKSEESWQRWLLKAKDERAYRNTHLAKLKGNKSIANEFSKIYDEFAQTGELPVTEIMHIENEARRLIYLAFFEKMAADGIDNFFTQNPEP